MIARAEHSLHDAYMRYLGSERNNQIACTRKASPGWRWTICIVKGPVLQTGSAMTKTEAQEAAQSALEGRLERRG